MKKIIISTKDCDHVFDFPENISEIDVNYLKAITDNVKLANDYVLVGIAYRQNLNELVTINKSNKNQTTMAVPLMIKAGKSDDTFINNLKLGDKLIVAGSDLAMGYHVSCPINNLSGAKFMAVHKNGFTNNHSELAAQLICTDVFMVEFKIIPACNIHAVVGTYEKAVIDKYYKIEYKDPE